MYFLKATTIILKIQCCKYQRSRQKNFFIVILPFLQEILIYVMHFTIKMLLAAIHKTEKDRKLGALNPSISRVSRR